jgi:gluconokinase
LISERLANRPDHYMNPSLLDSQIATLERPTKALRIVNDQAPNDIVNEIMKRLNG